jgi:predicted RNA-binding protein YlxR (DUF448 family)
MYEEIFRSPYREIYLLFLAAVKVLVLFIESQSEVIFDKKNPGRPFYIKSIRGKMKYCKLKRLIENKLILVEMRTTKFYGK